MFDYCSIAVKSNVDVIHLNIGIKYRDVAMKINKFLSIFVKQQEFETSMSCNFRTAIVILTK